MHYELPASFVASLTFPSLFSPSPRRSSTNIYAPSAATAAVAAAAANPMGRTKKRSPAATGPQTSFKPARQKFYAVRYGRDGVRGVFDSWDTVKNLVVGVSNASHKSFSTRQAAEDYLRRAPAPAMHNPLSSTTTTTTTATTTVTTATNPTFPATITTSSALHQRPSSKKKKKPTTITTTTTSTATASLPMNIPSTAALSHFASSATALPSLPVASYSNTYSNSLHQQSQNNDPNSSRPEYNIPSPEDLASAAPDPCPEAPRRMSIYTDGACENNGKRNARAGYGVYFGDESPYNVSERLHGLQTNQRAEMTAVLEAMRVVLDHGLVARGGELLIHSDSKYTINGLDSWIKAWKIKNWMTAGNTPVKNKELWMELDTTRTALGMFNIIVHFCWVKGHSGIHGNEVADRLAVAGLRSET